MAKYSLTNEARADLKQIARFIAKDNPAAAQKVLHAIRDTIVMLSDNKGIGRRLVRRECEVLMFNGKRPAQKF